MFTFMLGAVISTTATTQALLQLVCRDRGITQAACHKTDLAKNEWDVIVATATGWSEWILAAKTLPAALIACSGGFLSDRIGRRRLLLAPVVGELFWAITIVLVLALGCPFYVLPVAAFFSGVSGSVSFFLGLSFASLADFSSAAGDTTSTKRAKFSLLDGALHLGSTVGPLLAGTAISDLGGYEAPFFVSMGVFVVSAIILFTIPWTHQCTIKQAHLATPDASPKRVHTTLADAMPWRVVASVFGSSHTQQRLLIVLSLYAWCFFGWLYGIILFLKARFGLEPDAIGQQLAVAGALRALSNFFYARFSREGSALHGVSHYRTLLMSLTSLALYFLALAFANAPWQLYPAGLLLGGAALAAPLLRGLFSNAAPSARQGETLSAVAAVESAMQVVASITFLELYRRTLTLWSGFAWTTATIIMIFAVLVLAMSDMATTRSSGVHRSKNGHGHPTEPLLEA